LAKYAQRRARLGDIVAEMDSGFERTAALVRKHQKVLEIIAAAAYSRVLAIGVHNLAAGQILLSQEQIRAIWDGEKD
jgi:hypothetical protein